MNNERNGWVRDISIKAGVRRARRHVREDDSVIAESEGRKR